MKQRELQTRLVRFGVCIINISEELPTTRSAIHLGNQLLRSGTSPALNYAEARAAESRRDFIHKLKVVLKELIETSVNLEMIMIKNYEGLSSIRSTYEESLELISIFTVSLKTLQNNR